MKSKNSGFYSNGVVFLNYSAEWSSIEKYQELENGLRIIHKEKGAFDINLNSYEKNEIILIMNNIGIKKDIKMKKSNKCFNPINALCHGFC